MIFQGAANRSFVQNAICLGAGSTDSVSFTRIERAKLNAALIGGECHCTAQSVHLAHEMSLADTANRRIAAHLPEGFDVVGEQQSLAAHAGGGECRLGSGVAAADDDNVKVLWVKHGKPF